ncbi:Signal peptidase complex subunit 2 [Linum perenne]
MENKPETTPNKNQKKANLLDQNSIKNILDESVSEVVTSRGYSENVRMSNLKLLLGTVIIAVALVAQFYKKKFPENRDFLIGCILIIFVKEKNAILFTYPPQGSYTSTGLMISSKLPRFGDDYTLTIESADPKSISAGKTVHLTKSVTKWLTKDGVLAEGIFWKDVNALIDAYAGEAKKSK